MVKVDALDQHAPGENTGPEAPSFFYLREQ
jgi:hypothetical protein